MCTSARRIGLDTRISRRGHPSCVAIADGLFLSAEEPGLTEESIARPPFPIWRISDPSLSPRLTSNELPLVSAVASDLPVTIDDGGVGLHFDLFGAVFTALSRLEELASPARDRHERFPLQASLAWRGGFHERPLADEYCEVLAWALWKAGVLGTYPHSRDTYRVLLTHDVDRPVSALEDGVKGLLRRTSADVVIRRDMPARILTTDLI